MAPRFGEIISKVLLCMLGVPSILAAQDMLGAIDFLKVVLLKDLKGRIYA